VKVSGNKMVRTSMSLVSYSCKARKEYICSLWKGTVSMLAYFTNKEDETSVNRRIGVSRSLISAVAPASIDIWFGCEDIPLSSKVKI